MTSKHHSWLKDVREMILVKGSIFIGLLDGMLRTGNVYIETHRKQDETAEVGKLLPQCCTLAQEILPVHLVHNRDGEWKGHQCCSLYSKREESVFLK